MDRNIEKRFFHWEENKSSLAVLGTRVNEHRRAIREMDNQVNQHIHVPQSQHTDKVADDSIVIQRQISHRITETKAPEHQWDDRFRW